MCPPLLYRGFSPFNSLCISCSAHNFTVMVHFLLSVVFNNGRKLFLKTPRLPAQHKDKVSD